MKTLQDLCRAEVIGSVSLERMQQVGDLPLPSLLRDQLTTFRIHEDFDLEGLYMDYNFNFPNHVHHQNHQIHPGVCRLDGSKVLIKSQKLLSPCACCEITGRQKVKEPGEREIWAALRHPNLLNCLFSMIDPTSQLVCYVLEFPEITLQDFAFRLQFFGHHVPEYLVWQTIYKLTQVFDYLMGEKLEPVALCQPQHIVIDSGGEIKVENLLLYLPDSTGSHYRTTVIHSNLASFYSPPEETMGLETSPEKTIAWCLGCILYELTSYMPPGKTGSYSAQPLQATSPIIPAVNRYSAALLRLTAACLCEDPGQRLPLTMIRLAAERAEEKLRKYYKGPSNLLQLLPDVSQDSI